jgi:IS30 family transposase
MSLAFREVRRRFWRSIREGLAPPQAAVTAGVSTRTGWYWFYQAGGVPPLSLRSPNSPRRLSQQDRERIQAGLSAGWSFRQIAREIGRAPSTITREVKSNRAVASEPAAVPAGRRAGSRGAVPVWLNYSPLAAQRKAEQRARRPKMSKLTVILRLRAEVASRLQDKHSPEQISHRLKLDFPDDPEMQVSHETIYRSLYVQGRGELQRELTRCLRTGRALRKPRRRSGERRPRMTDMVMIADRPPEVEDRALPGHWEGDCLLGQRGRSAIGTLVERKTRFTVLLHLPGGHTAQIIRDAMITAMGQIPGMLRNSMTWDQGSEMARHLEIARALELDVYFCDPHAPWQRGTNENTVSLVIARKGRSGRLVPAA